MKIENGHYQKIIIIIIPWVLQYINIGCMISKRICKPVLGSWKEKWDLNNNKKLHQPNSSNQYVYHGKT